MYVTKIVLFFGKSDHHNFSHTQVILMTSLQHMYIINTTRTTWKHCHVCCVNRGYPRGHMLVTHKSKQNLLRNLPGETKRDARAVTYRDWPNLSDVGVYRLRIVIISSSQAVCVTTDITSICSLVLISFVTWKDKSIISWDYTCVAREDASIVIESRRNLWS